MPGNYPKRNKLYLKHVKMDTVKDKVKAHPTTDHEDPEGK